MSFIKVANAGKNIKSTNYWESEYAKNGVLYLTSNAGCTRLLIPPSMDTIIPEIKTGKVVVISKGFWPRKGETGIEIMFEDYSASPYVLCFGLEQVERQPEDSTKWLFRAITQAGIVYEKKCKVRTVQQIPYMQTWGK